MELKELKEYIFQNSKIEFVLEKLGCRNIVYHENHNYFSASWHDGDNPQGINIKNNEWLNFRSYTRGVSYEDNKDIFNLVEMSRGSTFAVSIRFLSDILDIDMSKNYTSKKKKPNKTPDEKRKEILSVFTRFNCNYKPVNVNEFDVIDTDIFDLYSPTLHINWVHEGIMSWTRKKFGLLYSYKRNRMIIPIRHWLTGKVVGTNSRTMFENYKDLNIKKYIITPTYKKQSNIYGLYENMQSILENGYVVVYEAEKSVLKRDSKGDATGVAISGHTLSYEQCAILVGLKVDIIFAMDKDVAEEEVLYMCEKVFLSCSKNVYYIYDDIGLLDDKESPADACNLYYDMLFDNKKRYDFKKHYEFEKQLKK